MNDRYALQKSVGARNIKPILMGFPDSSVDKESSAMQETPGSIPGLGRSLEKGKATHSSILAWRISWTV